MLVVALLALKREENKPEHVEGSQQRRGQPEGIERVSNFAPAVFVLERTQQNRVLAEKSRKRRKTRDGQRGRRGFSSVCGIFQQGLDSAECVPRRIRRAQSWIHALCLRAGHGAADCLLHVPAYFPHV